MFLFLRFVSKFVQDALTLILPMNIAIYYNDQIPLKEDEKFSNNFVETKFRILPRYRFVVNH